MKNERNAVQKVSIIIPCFNEKNTIKNILEVVAGVNIAYEKEIIVIDDASNDGTREILAKLRDSFESRTNFNNGGGQ